MKENLREKNVVNAESVAPELAVGEVVAAEGVVDSNVGFTVGEVAEADVPQVEVEMER